MYVTKRVAVSHQGIATLLAVALVLWGMGFHMFTNVAEASNVTSYSDTLSDSAPSSASDHTVVFTTPNGGPVGSSFTLSFDVNFDTSAVVIGDIDLLIDGNSTTTNDGAAGAGAWGLSGIGTDDITFTTPTDFNVPSSTVISILIGPGVATGGTNSIINPSATTSYEFDITANGGGWVDTGHTRVAIIENVEVTATVDTILNFNISGVASSSVVNSSPTTTTASSSNVLLPFGTLTSGQSKTLAQDLDVQTNAANGYVVTVYMDNAFRSSTNAEIDGFIDGSDTNTPTSWTSPSGDISDPTTWGHWAITSEDATTTRSGGDEFDADEWAAPSTTPIVVMSHTGPSDGSTQGIGEARVGYQVQITSLQEAGDDYSTTLTYVATPTF